METELHSFRQSRLDRSLLRQPLAIRGRLPAMQLRVFPQDRFFLALDFVDVSSMDQSSLGSDETLAGLRTMRKTSKQNATASDVVNVGSDDAIRSREFLSTKTTISVITAIVDADLTVFESRRTAVVTTVDCRISVDANTVTEAA